MKFLLGLLVGIIVAGGVIWYYSDQKHNSFAEDAKNRIEATASAVKESVQNSWKNLSTEQVKDELARTGRVVRQKAEDIGQAVADATADARITAAIKAKLLANPDLSVWSISVNTTGGRVTLSGTVSSADKIREAILLAMDTDGVQQVISTLQVKS